MDLIANYSRMKVVRTYTAGDPFAGGSPNGAVVGLVWALCVGVRRHVEFMGLEYLRSNLFGGGFRLTTQRIEPEPKSILRSITRHVRDEGARLLCDGKCYRGQRSHAQKNSLVTSVDGSPIKQL
jgi:hypothetical protein